MGKVEEVGEQSNAFCFDEFLFKDQEAESMKRSQIRNRHSMLCSDSDDDDQIFDMSANHNYRQTVVQTKRAMPSPSVEVVQETNKDCPGHHGLISSQASDNTITECAECKKIMFLKEDLYGCRWCDYNLCIPCYKGENEKEQSAENNKDLDDCKTMRTEDQSNGMDSIAPVDNTKQRKTKKKKKSKSPPSRKRRKLTIRIPRSPKKTPVSVNA